MRLRKPGRVPPASAASPRYSAPSAPPRRPSRWRGRPAAPGQRRIVGPRFSAFYPPSFDEIPADAERAGFPHQGLISPSHNRTTMMGPARPSRPLEAVQPVRPAPAELMRDRDRPGHRDLGQIVGTRRRARDHGADLRALEPTRLRQLLGVDGDLLSQPL